MPKFNDLSGRRFGRLIANRRIGRSDGMSKHSIWECKCDCGKIVNIVSTSLTRSLTRSCGCYFIETAGRNGKTLPPGRAAFNVLIYTYKKGAKKRDLEWNLSEEQFKVLVDENCVYCGEIPKQSVNNAELNGDYIHNGIDRLNNKKGYTIQNSVTCCGTCNWLKSRFHESEFLQQIEKIYNYRIKGNK